MFLEYDADADAIYVRLSDKERASTTSLGDDRHVDVAGDGTSIGVEFLNVSRGINLGGVPEMKAIARLLESVRAVRVA